MEEIKQKQEKEKLETLREGEYIILSFGTRDYVPPFHSWPLIYQRAPQNQISNHPEEVIKLQLG